MTAWHAWVERNQPSIVDGGGPLGRTKKASRKGIEDIRNAMAAYVEVQAETHDDAVAIFPGEGGCDGVSARAGRADWAVNQG